eukprot:11228313-Lingulodinium_polyedra.AAC.1
MEERLLGEAVRCRSKMPKSKFMDQIACLLPLNWWRVLTLLWELLWANDGPNGEPPGAGWNDQPEGLVSSPWALQEGLQPDRILDAQINYSIVYQPAGVAGADQAPWQEKPCLQPVGPA